MVRAVYCHSEEVREAAEPGKAPTGPGWHEEVIEELRQPFPESHLTSVSKCLVKRGRRRQQPPPPLHPGMAAAWVLSGR